MTEDMAAKLYRLGPKDSDPKVPTKFTGVRSLYNQTVNVLKVIPSANRGRCVVFL